MACARVYVYLVWFSISYPCAQTRVFGKRRRQAAVEGSSGYVAELRPAEHRVHSQFLAALLRRLSAGCIRSFWPRCYAGRARGSPLHFVPGDTCEAAALREARRWLKASSQKPGSLRSTPLGPGVAISPEASAARGGGVGQHGRREQSTTI